VKSGRIVGRLVDYANGAKRQGLYGITGDMHRSRPRGGDKIGYCDGELIPDYCFIAKIFSKPAKHQRRRLFIVEVLSVNQDRLGCRWLHDSPFQADW
jgi:hypothetical protein